MKVLHYKLSIALLPMLLLPFSARADTLHVNCGGKDGKAEFTTIGAAVAKISREAKRAALGPNTIRVLGHCVENVTIASLDNVTFEAVHPGVSISDASGGTLDTLVVVDSNRFVLNGFIINGSVNCANNAVCRLYGNTIQNSQAGYGLRASRAHIDSQNDSIINNAGIGVIATNEARIVLYDDTVSNNGGHGIQVTYAGFVLLTSIATTTTVSNNAGFGIFGAAHGTVRLQVANVTGNRFDGIRVQDGSVLRTDYVAPTVNNITGNGAAGVNLGDLSHAFFADDGSMNITGNLGGIDVHCAGQFAATRNVAIVGGITNCVEPNPESAKSRNR